MTLHFGRPGSRRVYVLTRRATLTPAIHTSQARGASHVEIPDVAISLTVLCADAPTVVFRGCVGL